MSESKPCEFASCSKPIPVYLMFCKPHWEMLPERMRSRINRAARRLSRRPGRRDRLRTLWTARDEARAFIREQESGGVLEAAR